jgi:hypothetical protein
MRRALPLVFALLSGCATLAPRFDQEVAASFAQDDMRKLVTSEVELYYPAQHAEAARRVAARAAECLRRFREKSQAKRTPGRALLFLTSANYNNAYVGGQALGEPLQSLNPLSVTSELFHWYGLGGAEAGDIACHEMFHYAHYEQTGGFWSAINTVFGPVFPPQAWLERWFTEGVAQFYEGRVFRPVGRPHSPLYRGSFESFVALRGGDVQPGDLSLWQRELNPFSGAYLTGYFFVEWLVERYGEDKLWKLMDLQGRSVFSPFGATLRVNAVYGRSVGALVDEWRDELKRRHVARSRPATQRVLVDDVGQLARLASHPASGTLALISSGNEQVPMLRILEADGRVRVETRLVRLGTDRDWVFAGPGTMSGLSFTADGRWLWLLNDDLVSRGDTLAQLWQIDARTGEVVRVISGVGRGMGGGVSPDGRTYVRVDFPPSGGSRLVERDLDTGVEVVLHEFEAGVSVAAPQWDAAHRRLVFSRQDANGWNLVLREADGALRAVTTDGAFTYGARWIDEGRVVSARRSGALLQAHVIDVASGEATRLSDAPFGVIDVAPVPGGAAFLNRVDVRWSVDVVPGAVVAQADAGCLAPPPPPPRASGGCLDGVPADDDEAPATLGETPTATSAPDAGETATAAEVAAPGDSPPSSGRHEPPPLVVEREEPYSALDGLFVPQLRVPGLLGMGIGVDDAGAVQFVATLAASLMGRDRLGKHTWAINGTLWVPDVRINSLQLGYRNLALAPWALTVNASRSALAEEAYWSGGLYASRTFFSAPVSFGVQTEVWQPFGQRTEKFIGPTFSISYFAGDSTAYAGTQRALGMSLDVAGYPRAFGSDRDMLDVRAGVSLAFPLPLSKRHSFSLSGAGRTLPGAPTGALRVGGVSSFASSWEVGNRDRMPEAGPGTFLPGSLVEPLRGYDDFPIRAQHAFLAGARYRYAFIVDRGFASLLWLFPSFFFRQVDVEAFASAAFTDNAATPMARAAGAALSLRTVFAGTLPVSLTYQFAWRFDLGLPPLHVVGVSFD